MKQFIYTSIAIENYKNNKISMSGYFFRLLLVLYLDFFYQMLDSFSCLPSGEIRFDSGISTDFVVFKITFFLMLLALYLKSSQRAIDFTRFFLSFFPCIFWKALLISAGFLFFVVTPLVFFFPAVIKGHLLQCVGYVVISSYSIILYWFYSKILTKLDALSESLN